jgi:hypothetical protein
MPIPRNIFPARENPASRNKKLLTNNGKRV